ncbi:arylamine N-acetyltransferase 2 [Pseudovirgaria hyperparasitica]|uniref:Arylamine N-acetyltransferase 2 n=1 Tax=Pseudovirgaria hyperparasitica TaxID=470096 RepID=A0A6A6VYR2_9PEZI|nr:arylamine N-acetyltransferase 2 [Pseudovirgaria hyperparasitica]KAF2754884.1 arylamine N-acetyltransferase 2 [Pseudovirgaria hyperparasitica]
MGPSVIYGRDQLDRYFKRINLPERHQHTSIASLTEAEQLRYLSLLQRYNLVAIPFENLSLHYSQAGTVTLHPDALYHKIVDDPGRGGYCMEINRLFGTVLLSLGFQLYSAGARVKTSGPAWTGFSHMCNIVTIGQRKYMVDVGFGPNSAIQPLELVKDDPPVVSNIGPASTRLIWTELEEHTDPDQRAWVYQFRTNDDAEWRDWYSFPEVEFFPADYEVMNLSTSTSRRIWFTREVICVSKEMSEGSDDALVGEVVLWNGLLKRSRGGKNVEIIELTSEEDRIEALERYFKITLSRDEKDAIKGLATALKGRETG